MVNSVVKTGGRDGVRKDKPKAQTLINIKFAEGR